MPNMEIKQYLKGLILRNSLDDVIAYVEITGDVDSQIDEFGRGILHANPSMDVAQYLLHKGANPNSRDKDGITPIINAISNNNLPYVQLLLEGGADPNKGPQLPLHWLAMSHDVHNAVPIAELLFEHGANPLARMGDITALDYARRITGANKGLINVLKGFEAQYEAMQQKEAITQGLKDSWSPDTDDGKRLLDKLSASAPGVEQESRQARRKM